MTIFIEIEIASVIISFKDETRIWHERFEYSILVSSTIDFGK